MNEVAQGNEFWNWIVTGFSKLQQADEPYFQWMEKNLLFTDIFFKRIDLIDKYNASLICSALKNKNQLMTIFPDKNMSRSALLFAASLMLQYFDCSKKSLRNSHVLYFGSTVNIRNQLGNIRLKNLRINLDRFFPQARLLRYNPNQIKTNESNKKGWDPYLPQIVYVYSPLDPVSILKEHSPDWIAVDCEDKANLPWLQPLLEYSQLNQIPLVAWSMNPFSECVNDFKKTKSMIFSWPHNSYKSISSSSSTVADHYLIEYLSYYKNTWIKPILIYTNYDEEITNAYKNLAKVSNINAGRLVLDASRVGWSFLRTIESLPIPLDLYEAEVRNFWGLKQVDSLHRAFLQFIEAVNQTNPNIGLYLEEACNSLERIYIQLQNNEPPLWLALKEICNCEVKKDEVKVIIFPSAGRKQLFAFALLARANITNEDLQERQIILMSIEEFRLEISLIEKCDKSNEIDSIFNKSFKNLSIRPLLIGLPSSYLTSKLDTLLMQDYIDILIYSYQHLALNNRIEQWNNTLADDVFNNIEVLSKYFGDVPEALPPKVPLRYLVDSEDIISIKNVQKSTKPLTQEPLLLPVNRVEEIALLLQTDIGNSDELLDERDIRDANIKNEFEKVLIEEALEVHFNGDWVVLFAPDETINLIYAGPKGEKIDERYVRSLETGDRILYIHGQKSQRLYDLIISRIYNIPAIEVHINLIRRWHDDFISAIQRKYDTTGMNLDDLLYDLLNELKNRGSKLTSPETLHTWLRGFVLSPKDPEDLRRLSESLNMTFTLEYYKRIDIAAERLRGIQIRLSHSLPRYILQKYKGVLENEDDVNESIDDELGLTLHDFIDSVIVLEVTSLNKRVGPFYRDELGNLEKEE